MSFLIRFLGSLLIGYNASAQINASFFPYKDSYHVRGFLSDIAVLNLDKDTKPDVVVSDFANDNITFFYNNGDCPNSLIKGNSLIADDGPVAIDTSDFNQDGRTDFAVLNALSNSVCVYKNHISPAGLVSIIPFGTYAVGDSPKAILTKDMDGDGKDDLLISQSNNGLVYILRNTSTTVSIEFEQAIILPSTLSLETVAVEDLNEDDKLDLIVFGESAGHQLLFFQNQSSPGHISFLPPVVQPIDFSPVVLKLADIDNDGKKEVLAASTDDSRLLLLHNDASPGLVNTSSLGHLLYIETFAGIIDIEVADFNTDQKMDVLALHPTIDSFSVWTNVCISGTWDESIFLSPQKIWAGDNPVALTLTDLNSDGKRDLLNTNQEFRNLVVQYAKDNICASTGMTFPASAANYYSRYNPGEFILTGVGSGLLTWYGDSTLHEIMGSGNQFRTPWLDRTDTFYVTNSTSCCESAPIAVIAAVICSILPPKPVSAYRCGPGTISLEALSNEEIRWYKKFAKDTVVIARGATLTLPYLDRSDTFYVAAVKETCKSQRATVVASIFPVMQVAEVKAETGICSSNGIHAYIPASQKGIRYYLMENETLHSYSGNGTFLSLGNYPIGTPLQVLSANACDSISLNIQYQDSRIPIVPNLVTANSDGTNDDFFIMNLPAPAQLSIYNSWGIQVFSSQNYENNWGAREPSGIYFYELQFEQCGQEENHSGWLQVISNK